MKAMSSTLAFAQKLLRLPAPGGRLVPMQPHPEQRRFLTEWDRRKADGTRLYRQGLISWPKQSFKTTTAQTALLADLYTATGPDREYVVVSTGATQANDVGFAGLARFVERQPALKAVTKIYSSEIVYEALTIDSRTGGSYVQPHRVTALPSQRSADWHHGRPLHGAWIDEAWALGDRGYALLESVMPSPTRDGWLLVTSYAGLRQHAKPGNLLYDLWQRAQQSDPLLCASILSGPAAYAGMTHVTTDFLAAQEALLAHVPGRRDRLWKNLWTTADEGSLLTAREITAAVDDALPVPAVPVPGVRYALGVDLGYSHDWAAACLSHVSPDGRLIVDHVEFWTGTPAQPVNFRDVEDWIVGTAQRFRLQGIWGDQWQFLGMKANLAHRLPHVPVTAVTVESARLDHYAIFLKGIFSGRCVSIPTAPIELREQLEGIVAVESTARDRLKLQSGTGPGARSFDDLVIALLLSTEGHQRLRVHDGKVYGTSQIDGRPRVAPFEWCVIEGASGGQWVGRGECPLLGAPSALQGCRRCPGWASVTTARDSYLASGAEWLDFPTFARTRMTANRWMVDRGVREAAERLGLG